MKVLFVLNTMANNDLTIRVGHATIARAAGISREKAALVTKELERKGFIECTYRGRTLGQSGKRHSNEYRLASELPQLNSAAGGTIETRE